MNVRRHLEYTLICRNPFTKHNIDKPESVLRRDARFVLNFYDYRPTADLSGKIFAMGFVADLCMFYELRNNLANIAVLPMIVPSVKHDCIHSDALNTIF